MKTIFIKPAQMEHKWYLIDAKGVVLGRLAVKAASLLRGKHKAHFVPNQEVGDFVIVVNAGKAKLTGRKAQDKMYYRHTGFPGGLRSETYAKVVSRKPTFPLEQAIKGMLPHGPLGRQLFRHLKVYAGPDHPHGAQMPAKIEL
jgi:large subunit ribosomal protein L13